MILECQNCGNPDASLEPLWGAHQGEYRASFYQCTGYDATQGCGHYGVEIYVEEDNTHYLFGAIQQAEPVDAEPR